MGINPNFIISKEYRLNLKINQGALMVDGITASNIGFKRKTIRIVYKV